MKKLAVIWENFEYGGVSTHLQNLLNSKYFKKKEIIIITNHNNRSMKLIKKNLENPNIKFIYYKSLNMVFFQNIILKSIFLIIRPFLFFLSILQFYLIFKKNNFDILLANCGGYGDFRSEMAASISASFFKNKSTNLLIHHCYIKPKFWKILAKVVNVFFVKKLDNIFYVSKATERSIKKNISTFKKNKNSTVIYNGIKLNKPILNSSKKFFNQIINLKKIGMLARVDESKGQEDLIDAFSKLDKQVQKKYIIYLIGNGKIKYLNKLKLKVKEFGISKSFKFQNYINDRSENILSHLNLFFSLSRDFEGFGYSAVEAAAVGTPVIVTNVGATKEIFSSNNAAIIQPRNLKQIKNLLENFNKNTKVFKKKAKKAKLHILKNFNAEIMSKKFYKKLYK